MFLGGIILDFSGHRERQKSEGKHRIFPCRRRTTRRDSVPTGRAALPRSPPIPQMRSRSDLCLRSIVGLQLEADPKKENQCDWQSDKTTEKTRYLTEIPQSRTKHNCRGKTRGRRRNNPKTRNLIVKQILTCDRQTFALVRLCSFA